MKFSLTQQFFFVRVRLRKKNQQNRDLTQYFGGRKKELVI